MHIKPGFLGTERCCWGAVEAGSSVRGARAKGHPRQVCNHDGTDKVAVPQYSKKSRASLVIIMRASQQFRV